MKNSWKISPYTDKHFWEPAYGRDWLGLILGDYLINLREVH